MYKHEAFFHLATECEAIFGIQQNLFGDKQILPDQTWPILQFIQHPKIADLLKHDTRH